MEDPVLLGIDIGSTALKAAVFDLKGRQAALARLEYRRAPQGPEDWWQTTLRAVTQLTSRRPDLASAVAAVGLSGRGSTRILLDRGGRPLSLPPGFGVSADSLRRVGALAGPAYGVHGLRFLAALLELRREHPSEFREAAHAMTAKDYVLFQMTGHFVTDPASSVGSDEWPERVTSAPEFESLRLCEIRQPWVEGGRLREPVAAELGLPPGIPIATGAHDGAAAAVGVGAAVAGAHPVTLGTNSVYRIVSADASQEANRFWPVLPGLTAYGADVTLGGYAIDWLLRLFGAPHGDIAAAAAVLPPGAEGLTFLPQIRGRMLPEPSAGATRAFTGIRPGIGRPHFYRAVLEGNAFALRSIRETLLAQGLPDGPVYLTGGGARSPLFRRIVASGLGRPVRWTSVEEGCRGAAVFAAVTAGAYPDVWAAMGAMAGGERELRPGPDASQYEAAYQRFLRVRAALDQTQA